MFFYLKITSKNKKVVNNFTKSLSKLTNSSVAVKYFPRQKKRSFITILKSPHVYKTAQEQFEYRVYKKHFLIHSFKPFSFFLLLKKLINCSFAGFNLEIKGLIGAQQNSQNYLKAIDPDNIILFSSQKIKYDNSVFTESVQRYIQLFDSYGEMYLKISKS